MNSFVHVDNKGKDVLILGEGPTQGLDDTKSTAKAEYPINFTQSKKRFVTQFRKRFFKQSRKSLHYKESNSFLIVNATKVYHFKAKDPEINDYKLGLGNVTKDFTINNIEKN